MESLTSVIVEATDEAKTLNVLELPKRSPLLPATPLIDPPVRLKTVLAQVWLLVADE